MPSNPPASPHRAGHYSGLHPEDQPFQSSFMPVQRPAAITRRLVEQEPEQVFLPAATARPTTLPLTPLPEQSVSEQLSKRQVATPSPLPLPLPQRSVGSQTALPVQLPQRQFAVPALSGEPPVPQQGTTAPLKALSLPRKSSLHKHLVPVLLLASLLFFLLATSVLAFQLINRRPLVPVQPALNNASTAATPQQAPSTSTKLQLSSSRLDFGADLPGTISRKPITLTSAGGGQIDWRAGIATDSPWLTITPRSGTFSGRETVTLAVNRGILAPQSYTGYVTFFQQGNNNTPLTLTVTMKVSPTFGNLSLAPTSLSFNGTTTQNPSSQELIVQNTGGQALDWMASAGTSTGGNWLSLSDVSGHLLANSQQTLTASANSTGLGVGSYQGSLTFSHAGSSSLQVLVILTISPPTVPGMGVSSNLLKFGVIQGRDPQPQSFTVTNTGNGPLNWAITEDANGAAFVPVSPPRGTVPPGKSVTITVRPHVARATAGVINARITISDTDKGPPVRSRQVAVAITISSQAVISVSDSRLKFNHSSAASNSTQLLVITNTGSAQLNWTLSQSLPSWLSVDIPGGTLPSGASTFVNVTCDSSGLPANNYTYTLVVSDTDPGTQVTPQNVQVTMTVT
jgi:Viral BACON domain